MVEQEIGLCRKCRTYYLTGDVKYCTKHSVECGSCHICYSLEFADLHARIALLEKVAEAARWYKKMVESGKWNDDHAVATCEDLEQALLALDGGKG